MNNIGIFSNSHKVRILTAHVTLLAAAFPVAVQSGFERSGCGARAISLANAYVAMADDTWAVFYNPVGIAKISSIQAAAFFPPQFGMRELSTVSAGATLPTRYCIGGVVIDQFSYDLYKEACIRRSWDETE